MMYLILLFIGLLFCTGVQATQSNCSKLLKSYESQRIGADEQVVSKVRTYGRKVREKLVQTHLGHKISAVLRGKAKFDAEIMSIDLSSKTRLVVKLLGPGKGFEVLRVHGARSEVVFTTSSLRESKNITFGDLQVAPGHRNFLVAFYERGSTDQAKVQIVNLNSRRSYGEPFSVGLTANLAWLTANELVYRQPGSQNILMKYNVHSQKHSLWSLFGHIRSRHESGLVVTRGGQTFIHLPQGDVMELPNEIASYRLVGADDSSLYFWDEHSASPDYRLHAVNKNVFDANGLPNVTGIIRERSRPILDVQLKDGFFLFQEAFGDHRQLVVFDIHGRENSIIPLPDHGYLLNMKWLSPGRRMSFAFNTPLHKKIEVTYDLDRSEFESDVIEAFLTDYRGRRYETRILNAMSADGTNIPVRLMYRQGLFEGQGVQPRPTLINSYGGFGVTDHFRMYYDPMFEEFMARGGVLASPALRGGKEFGQPWHEAAKNQGKRKTFQDLIAVAETLTSNKITVPELIISMGHSNGALTVTAAATARPELFGLVIPINGIFDFSRRESLDASQLGWVYEYGSSEKDVSITEAMKPYDPVKNGATAAFRNVLVVTGLSDTRVHPQHSFNFVSELENSPHQMGEVHWLGIKNAGHYLTAIERFGLAGIYAQTAIWTAIFKQAGWSE